MGLFRIKAKFLYRKTKRYSVTVEANSPEEARLRGKEEIIDRFSNCDFELYTTEMITEIPPINNGLTPIEQAAENNIKKLFTEDHKNHEETAMNFKPPMRTMEADRLITQ